MLFSHFVGLFLPQRNLILLVLFSFVCFFPHKLMDNNIQFFSLRINHIFAVGAHQKSIRNRKHNYILNIIIKPVLRRALQDVKVVTFKCRRLAIIRYGNISLFLPVKQQKRKPVFYDGKWVAHLYIRVVKWRKKYIVIVCVCNMTLTQHGLLWRKKCFKVIFRSWFLW